MRKRVALVATGSALLLGFFVAPASAQAVPGSTAATVRVSTVAGAVEAAASAGPLSFRGIPYAAAPIGMLRWHEPMPPSPWAGVRNADAFGKACPQDRKLSIDQAGDPGPTDEDCLFVNVWTPHADSAARLPVMVWIHGGAFIIGAGSQTLYDGTALAARGAVVVTFNYRLGALGFFAHPALARSASKNIINFGLLDQVAALEWVRDNIAAFGGDPAKVTIFGESAGGQSVLALFASPRAHGLFRRGIAQSPYGMPSYTRAKAKTVAIAIADAVGTDGERATLEQLRAVPAETFASLNRAGVSLSPNLVAGDGVLPEPILAAFRAGREQALPLIVGNNSDDGSVAVDFGVDPAALIRRLGAARIFVKPLYPGQNDDALLGREVARDVVFSAFARRIAVLHSARAPTWRYYFSHLPSALQGEKPGVPHGGEIASVFGVDDACGCLLAPLSDADREVARRVGDYWFAFARNGAPDPANDIAWPADSRSRPKTMEFGDTFVVRDAFMQRRLNAFIAGLNLLGALPKR